MRARERGILVVLLTGVVAALPLLEAGAACHVASFVGDPYEVSEGAGKVTITVSNNGGQGSGTIDYETEDNTAKSGQDYDAKQGTLEFNEPTGMLSFDVTIKNDNKNEKTENFRVKLSNPTGCFSVVQEDTATVTIQDNDKLITLPTQSASPTPTPEKTTPKPKPSPSTVSASPSPSPTATSPSPTVSASPIAAPADDGGGLSGGALGGIVAAVVALGGVAAYFVRRRFLT